MGPAVPLHFDLQIHANCRIRRVYFSDRLYSEDELPAEFKLYLPVQNKAKVSWKGKKGEVETADKAIAKVVSSVPGVPFPLSPDALAKNVFS